MRYSLPVLVICVLTTLSQQLEIELQTRQLPPTRRSQAGALAGVPEVSRDGRYVLYVTTANNILETTPSSRAANLFMVDRQTRETTLISVGLNGQPANDHVEGYQFSADGRRVMFESRASNIVPNDAPNTGDVFIRDLDLNQTILVTGVNGIPRGGVDATITGDGQQVVFSTSYAYVENDRNGFHDVYVCDVSSKTFELISAGSNGGSVPGSYGLNPEMSDDGMLVAFRGPPNLLGEPQGTSFGSIFIRDRRTQTTTLVNAGLQGNDSTFVLSRDGSICLFIMSEFPNLRLYGFYTATKEVTPIDDQTALPIHVSPDGSTIIYQKQGILYGLRGGARTEIYNARTDPLLTQRSIQPVQTSVDGRYVALTAGLPQRPEITATNSQTYLFDFDTRAFSLVSPDGEPVETDVPSTPAISDDGSIVAFYAAASDLRNPRADDFNIFAWDRDTRRAELVSTSNSAAVHTSEAAGSALSEAFALSDDGSKLVYSSLSPAADVIDTNNTWDVFLLDRSTGARKIISVSEDGRSTLNFASYKPIISGNGKVIAWQSRSLNHFYVHNLESGATIVTPGFDLRAARNYPPSISRDGSRIAFVTEEKIDARDQNSNLDVHVLDTASGSVTLISHDSAGTAAGNQASTYAVISGDGQHVAFRSRATNLGVQGGVSNPVLIRDLNTGTLRRVSSNQASSGSNPVLAFNRGSTLLLHGDALGVFNIYNVTNRSNTTAVSNATFASFSEDGRWIAFGRAATGTIRRDLFVVDRNGGPETLIATNIGNANLRPKITDDGRYVIFQHRFASLSASDTNNLADIYLYDRANGSYQVAAANGNNASQRAVLSADNSFFVFQSFANNLVQGDFNEAADIFVAYMPGARIRITSTTREGDQMLIQWVTIPGRTYRLQGAVALDGSWEDIGSAVAANGESASAAVPIELPHRFFRILRQN